MKKGSIQPGIVAGKPEVCPACGSKFTHNDGTKEGKRRPFCPNHPNIYPMKYRVMFGNICHHHSSYESAETELGGFRHENMCGTFDERDYQVKAKPLNFDRLADEWLKKKAISLKTASIKPLRLAMGRAEAVWEDRNIKLIQFADVEDLINSLHSLSPKSKKHTLDALKQFWQWAVDRYDIPPMKKWPKLGYIEMGFRQTIDIETQEYILQNIRKHEPFRAWLAAKWLATYIAIRPGEMCSLTEGQVDRVSGRLIIPHPKEKRAKIIPLIQEDIDLIKTLPLAFDQEMPFFRHETGKVWRGKVFGPDLLYRVWRRACNRLNIVGVSLYPGTKHSTACGLREVATPEEIKAMTLHSTGAAFHRYFMTGGNDHRELSQRRQKLLQSDNGLTTKDGTG